MPLKRPRGGLTGRSQEDINTVSGTRGTHFEKSTPLEWTALRFALANDAQNKREKPAREKERVGHTHSSTVGLS